MNGKDLYFKYSERDYSGSVDDIYAQLLSTIHHNIGEGLFPLLEKAELENKRLSLKEPDQFLFIDSYIESDIIFV